MSTVEDINAAESKLKTQLAALRKFKRDGDTGDINAFRARQVQQKNEAHKRAAAIRIPAVKDPGRRDELEQDVYQWLAWYLPDVFTEGFEDHHKQMVQAILEAATYAGDQALAAPRREGKTTIAEGVTIYCTIRAIVFFPVIFAATGRHAENVLTSVKEYLCDSDRLAADYPGLCIPAREANSVPARARSMQIYGVRPDNGQPFDLTPAHFQWSGPEISFPHVPGMRCEGSRFATRGLDSEVRGLKKGTKRPDLAIIDDPDTAKTVSGGEQAIKLIDRIEKDIAGLAPRGKRMSRVMLTTLQNRVCPSAQFTDPEIKASWNGRRFAFLLKYPTNTDLWDEYVAMKEGRGEADRHGRRAHALYLENRDQMDAGAVPANPHSFDGRELADGTQLQVSAVQAYYDWVADNGLNSALSELQNDPPEETGPIESGITAYKIQTQVSGYPRKIVPPGTFALVQGIDCGKYYHNWVVKAFRADATAYVVAYGVQDVYKTDARSSDAAVDVAIWKALHARREEVISEPYTTPDGEIVEIQKTLVDAGYRTEAVYQFCREAGLSYEPCMGIGNFVGCDQKTFRQPVKVTDTKQPGGEGWYRTLKPHGTWLVGMDKAHWLGWEHDRWMTPPDMPGTCMMWGQPGKGDRLSKDQKVHLSFSKHLTAVIEREEPAKGGGTIRRWHQKSDSDHYFSASYQADVAANICGVSLLKAAKKQGQPRPSMADLAAKSKKGK